MKTILTIIAVGIATHYGDGEDMIGNHLYCDQFLPDTHTFQLENEPWVAFPVEWYETGKVECGEEYLILLGGKDTLIAKALDAGSFGGRKIRTGPVQGEIVVDIPSHHAPFFPQNGCENVIVVKLQSWAKEFFE